MPQPTKSDVHVNRPLTNISIAYLQNQTSFIADKVFANLPVMSKSDSYFTYDKEYWFSDEMQERAAGTESAGSGYEVNADNSYNCKIWALHKDVPDQIRKNTDNPLDADRDATIFLTQKAFIKREKQFTSQFFKLGIWTGSSTGTDITVTTPWDNAASTPIEDIDLQKEAIRENTGLEPNTLIVSPKVHRALKNHPDVVDRIKYSQKGVVTEEIIAELFEIDRYIVAKATNNTALEGQAASMNFIFGNFALLCYSNPTPMIMSPSAGYTFSWIDYLGATQHGSRMSKFRMDNLKSDRVEIEMAFDMKQVGADLGAFFTGLLT